MCAHVHLKKNWMLGSISILKLYFSILISGERFLRYQKFKNSILLENVISEFWFFPWTWNIIYSEHVNWSLNRWQPISNSSNVKKKMSILLPLLCILCIYIAQKTKHCFIWCRLIVKKILQLFYSITCYVLWYIMGVFKGNLLFASIAATNSHKTFCSMLAPAQGCDLWIC